MQAFDPKTSKLIQRLQLHNDSIEDLLFSPWDDPNAPLVLVSLAREIGFWDIKHMVNNPFNDRLTSPKQHSQRFKKRSQILPLHPSKQDPLFSFQTIEKKNIWQNKKGSGDRPELLACVRLIGRAEQLVASPDFTQFVTLDNEGEIYHLKVLDKDMATTPTDWQKKKRNVCRKKRYKAIVYKETIYREIKSGCVVIFRVVFYAIFLAFLVQFCCVLSL